MLMPKASVNLDYGTSPSKDNIGLSWQICAVKAIAIPEAVEQSSNK
jgi:hypothetical protein